MDVWVAVFTEVYESVKDEEKGQMHEQRSVVTYLSQEEMSSEITKYMKTRLYSLPTTLYRVAEALERHNESAVLLEMFNKYSRFKIETFETKMYHPLT